MSFLALLRAASSSSRMSGRMPFLVVALTKCSLDGVVMYWSGERLARSCLESSVE